jgi:hypothetical protein
MTIRLVARAALVAALVSQALGGCSKKEAPAVPDAGPPPAPEPTAPLVTELAPLEDPGGAPDDAAAEAGKKKWTGGGTGYNANQLKIKQCCNAIREQAKTLGASPEAFQLTALGTQCDAFAAQMGASGAAPELNQLREILKTAKVPLACQF